MKKHVLSITFFAILQTCFVKQVLSQITITQADIASVGDTVRMAKDTIPNGVLIGGTGMQTWDFSMLQLDEFEENRFLDPSNTNYASDFPNSNIAREDVMGNITYATKNSSSFIADGFAGDPFGFGVPIVLHFNPTNTIAVLPATLGTMFKDTSRFQYSMDASSFGIAFADSVRIVRWTYSDANIDAYGNTTTPAGTFDCLREFREDQTIDSVFLYAAGQWQLAPTFPGFLDENPTFDTTFIYSWYTNGEGMAVAVVEADSKGGNPLTASFKIKNKVIAGGFIVTNATCSGVCDGDATVNAYSGVPPYNYFWDASAGSQTTDMATGLCAGTYSVSVVDAVNDTAVASVVVPNEPEWTAGVAVQDATCSACADGKATASANGGFAPYTYQWDAAAANQTTQTATGLAPGDYDVTVTDSYGCTAVTLATIGVNNSILENNSGVSYKIYPNPNNGIFNISVGSNNAEITVYNMLGSVVYFNRNLTKHNQINLSGIESGLYFVKIESNGSSITSKMHINR
jgi:hypothetical protein